MTNSPRLDTKEYLRVYAKHALVLALCVVAGILFYRRHQLSVQSRLWIAIEVGDTAEIANYRANGGSLDVRHGTHLANPLIYSAMQNRPAAFNALLENGADPNARVSRGRKWTTAMHYTSTLKDTQWIVEALRKGGDPNVLDSNGRSPLDDAMSATALECVLALLEHGADPCVRQPVEVYDDTFLSRIRYHTPNVWANTPSESVCRRVFAFLMKKNLDPDTVTWSGESWEPGPIESGRRDVVLDRTDNLLESTSRSVTARTSLLHYSLLMGNKKAAEQLLRYGANPNEDYDRPGLDTNYMRSAARHVDSWWISAAMSYGGDANLEDLRYRSTGETLLMSSVYGNINNVKALLAGKAIVNKQDRLGRTAAVLAAMAGNYEAVFVISDFEPAVYQQVDDSFRTLMSIVHQEYPPPGVQSSDAQAEWRRKVLLLFQSKGRRG